MVTIHEHRLRQPQRKRILIIRGFSVCQVKYMDVEGESEGEISDYSTTVVEDLDKAGLKGRKKKLEGRLKTSKKNSGELCDHLETVTDELQNIVEANLDKLSAEDRNKFEQDKLRQGEGLKTYLDQWSQAKSVVGEVHDNHSSFTNNLLWSAWTRHLAEKGVLSPSNTEQANINVGESARVRKDLERNSDNLTKDSTGLGKISSKLSELENKKETQSSSLVADYADPSTEMPSYMDPED